MVISSQKNFILNIIGLGILTVLTSILFLSMGAFFLALFILLSGTLLLTSYGIVLGRTITFSSAGCSIKIGNIKRFIAWENMCIMRLEPPHLGLRCPYHNGGAFFSFRKVHKPRICDPCLYCVLFHPFSCFWVYFVPEMKSSNEGTLTGVYEVNKESFLSQLSVWGIELQS